MSEIKPNVTSFQHNSNHHSGCLSGTEHYNYVRSVFRPNVTSFQHNSNHHSGCLSGTEHYNYVKSVFRPNVIVYTLNKKNKVKIVRQSGRTLQSKAESQ